MIRHRGIVNGVTTDAPFIGARINAIDCHHNCPCCFNQELKKHPMYAESASSVIEQVKRCTLNKGIIFGGLEWSEQPEDLIELIHAARTNDLEVMIYTHHTEEEFKKLFPCFWELPIYVKFGEFKQELGSYADHENDVLLASTNQYIKKLGE